MSSGIIRQFYINYEEFKDKKMDRRRCVVVCFILTMRNLKEDEYELMLFIGSFYINYEEFKEC